MSNMSNSTATSTIAMISKRDTKMTSSEVVNRLNDKEVNKHVKLEIVIDRIFGLMENNSLEEAKSLLYQLVVEFEGDKEYFLPWVRFLDIAHVRKTNKLVDDKEKESFQQKIEEIMSKAYLSSQQSKSNNIDWRISRKMMSFQGDFSFSYNQKQFEKHILGSLKHEIHIALEYLLWEEESVLVDLAKKNLNSLHQLYDRSGSKKDLLLEAVLRGRFDKTKFDITNTIILGEDGGLYLLLNRLSSQQQEVLISQQIVTGDYLKDKVKAKDQVKGDKVVLGKGGFGNVRVGMSLLRSRSLPTEIVCVKKTRNISKLGLQPPSLEQITRSTLEDYFTNDRAEAIYSPCTFDMSLITSSEVIKYDKKDHRKGYLMMEMLPQNTATKIFSQKKYQKWEYQKPYLIDVLEKTLQLLDSNIAMTDLKPDNTLFDIDTCKATLIDLGGSVKVANREELEQFDRNKHHIQYTPGFISPELYRNTGGVDMYKSLAYTCGIVIEQVTKNSDSKQKVISTLVEELTAPDPKVRISIDEAIQKLDEMGDNSDKKSIIFSHYISKVKDRLERKKSAISINEDIEKTKELFIPLNATPLDPSKYNRQETEDLSKKIEDFLDPKNTQQVMAIFGEAGCGKSILLQLKFIEAINSWQPGKPLPIYINLANGIELDQIVKTLNTELGTNLSLDLLDGQHLYIDSFDEGLGIETKRKTLIKEYFRKSGSPKIIITCHTDYLQGDWHDWFSPESKKFEVCYVVPINYNGYQDMNSMVKQYVNYSKQHTSTKKTKQEYLRRLKDLQLAQVIDTGFMFFLVMEVLFTLDDKKERPINKLDIYESYIHLYQDDQIAKLENQKQKEKLVRMVNFSESNNEPNLASFVMELGKYLASQMHLRGAARLDHSNHFFTALDFDSSVLLKHQSIIHILKLLPLKIITTHSGGKLISNQEVKIGFMHETIKNYYLVKVIKSEIEREGKSLILATKSIADDFELSKLIACALQDDLKLRNTFLKAIDDTKTDKSNSSIIYGSNCITLLVAAKYPFSGCDLTNISVKHANLVHGIFHNANLSGADLSGVDMNNVNLIEASLDSAIMKGVKLFDSLSATLEGHTDGIRSISFSPDGTFLASGSWDKTIKIWNPTTGECLLTLKGHNSCINSVCFSSNGKFLASGSEDKTIKIWSPTTGQCLQILNGHNYSINSVSFSPDDKFLASGSNDKTIKIWNPATGECLQTLDGHTEIIYSVSFSPNSNLLASGSSDKTIKIWNPTTGGCLWTLSGHFSKVSSVSFSPDSKSLASGSTDDTIRVWDLTTGDCLQTLKGHRYHVSTVSFSPHGKFLASGSSDTTIKIWSPTTGECLLTLNEHNTFVTSVCFSPNGKFLASSSNDNIIKIFDSTIKECLQTLNGHTDYISRVTFSSDGKFLVSSSKDKKIKIWNSITGECLQTLNYMGVNFSYNDKFLANCTDDNAIKIWNTKTGECLLTLNEHTDLVTRVSFSSDGKFLASGSEDNTIKVWSLKIKEPLQTLIEYTSPANSINIPLDALDSEDETTSECLHTLNGHTKTITSVSFSPDGKFLASGSEDETIKIWNLTTGECLQTLKRHQYDVKSVRFSPDGKFLASCSEDRTIKIWNPSTGECLQILNGHTGPVNSVSFSPDNKFLISGSSDSLIKVWNPATGECLQTLNQHTGSVTSVSFSPDGKFFASGSSDQTIKVFQMHGDRWLLNKNITATLLPLRADFVNLNNTIISHNNRLLLYRNGAKGTDQNLISENDITIDQIEPPIDDASESIRTADQLSHTFFPEKSACFPTDLYDSGLLVDQKRKNWWKLLILWIPPLWILSQSEKEFS